MSSVFNNVISGLAKGTQQIVTEDWFHSNYIRIADVATKRWWQVKAFVDASRNRVRLARNFEEEAWGQSYIEQQ